MPIQSINPADATLLAEYDEIAASEVAAIIDEAHSAFRHWRRTPFAERALRLRLAAEILRRRTDDDARLMALEMGKPLAEGRAEIEKCASVCEYYAQNGETFLADQVIETDARRSFVHAEPLGVVLAVMPWNFPFWQVFRFAAPALMAGNVGLLKHSSNVFGCALAIEEILHEAGFPAPSFRTLRIGSAGVAAVVDHPLVKAVTLTGSTPAGRAVAGRAGERLKKTVLELGGSDAYVVLEDADLPTTVEACVTSRLINAGQSCIAAKRFVVVDEIRQEFEQRFVETMRRRHMGDPLDPEVNVGPQARHDLRDELHDQVSKSIAAGARCLLGGEVPEGDGAYYPPTVLADVRPGMPAYDEELFGPVAAIIPAHDESDAIRIANDSVFGLGAAVFTADLERGERIAAQELEAGSCFVNGFVRSDPRLPFGGIKESGYGRELSHLGILEFVNLKTVWIA
jgi:succinate-semialdehyde dehydrogenase/glutarate-semialdehyde dehydrogenase